MRVWFAYLAIYMDDCYVVGNSKAVEKVIKDIKAKGYTVQLSQLQDHFLTKGRRRHGWDNLT